MKGGNPRGVSEVGPTLRWGVGVGLLVAAFDTLAFVLSRGFTPDSDASAYIALADQFVNVVLFSLAGLRVGRQTRVVRAAAEAGVLAGIVAGLVATGVGVFMPSAEQPMNTPQDVIATLALNVAMGGVLALLNGWIATRERRSSPRG